MKISLHTCGSQLVWHLVPWSHVVQSFKLSWQVLCLQTSSYLAPMFTAQALTHTISTELIFYGISKLFFFFLKTNHSWSTHTMYKGVQDIQLTVPQGANTEQYGHKELTNTEYLSVLQNSPETHLELNKGNYFYCMWLSQTPLAQECFLDHFNSK